MTIRSPASGHWSASRAGRRARAAAGGTVCDGRLPEL